MNQTPSIRWVACLISVGLLIAACGTSSNSTKALNEIEGGIGTITYGVDTSDAALTLLSPDTSSPITLSIVDESGFTWQLVIPPQAVALPSQVTLTSMDSVNVKSTNEATHQATFSGVVIGPSSLVLIKTATLSVIAPSPKRLYGTGSSPTTIPTPTVTTTTVVKNPVPTTGKASYSTTTLSIPKSSSQEPTTVLYTPTQKTPSQGSFTSTTEPPNQSETLNPSPTNPGGSTPVGGSDSQVQGTYPPGTTPPPDPGTDQPPSASSLGTDPNLLSPPSVNLHCIDSLPSSDSVGNYVQAAQLPESTLIAALLAKNSNSQSDTDQKLEGQYLQRVANRITKFINSNLNNMNAFYAVALLTLNVSKQALVTGNDEISDSLSALLGRWAEQLLSNSLKGIVHDHDLTNVPEVLYIGQIAVLAGANGDAVVDQIQDALRFKLDIKEDVQVNLDPILYHMTLQGTITLIPTKIALGLGGGSLVVSGSGQMTYTTATFGSASVQASPFNTNVTATFSNLCGGPTVQILQSPYGGTEVISHGLVVPENAIEQYMETLVQSNSSGSSAGLSLSVTNKQSVMAQKTFSLDFPEGGATLSYTLNHTPIQSSSPNR